MRILLIGLILLAATEVTTAQQTIWNPNSPRGQREMRISPPVPQALPGQVGETFVPERWGTLSKPIGQPQWGTLGKPGWTGIAAPPW